MTPDQQAIIDQLRAAAAEWRQANEDRAIAEANARLAGLTEDEITAAREATT